MTAKKKLTCICGKQLELHTDIFTDKGVMYYDYLCPDDNTQQLYEHRSYYNNKYINGVFEGNIHEM